MIEGPLKESVFELLVCPPTTMKISIGVPSESIDEYAATHELTREEAIARMSAESNAR